MQKFRMLKTMKGVHDGELHPVAFQEGTTHVIGDSLASQFIDLGAVEMVDDDADSNTEGDDADEKNSDGDQKLEGDDSADDKTDGESKSEGDAPANKAKKAAPENKAKK